MTLRQQENWKRVMAQKPSEQCVPGRRKGAAHAVICKRHPEHRQLDLAAWMSLVALTRVVLEEGRGSASIGGNIKTRGEDLVKEHWRFLQGLLLYIILRQGAEK